MIGLVPAAVMTVMSTWPTDAVGLVAVIKCPSFTTNEAPAVPKFTVEAFANPPPLM